jgi:hypothetical protein
MLRALSVAWVLAVVAGMCVLQRYESRPGDDGAPAGHWPSETRLTLAPDRPTLLLFVDANCPCSRARAGRGATPLSSAARSPAGAETTTGE